MMSPAGLAWDRFLVKWTGKSPLCNVFARMGGFPPRPALLLIVKGRKSGKPRASALPYFDPEGRLDVKDVLHQIDWYRSQGMIKGEFDDKSVIDMRYVVPLPE